MQEPANIPDGQEAGVDCVSVPVHIHLAHWAGAVHHFGVVVASVGGVIRCGMVHCGGSMDVGTRGVDVALYISASTPAAEKTRA